jgi:hypothetical protein
MATGTATDRQPVTIAHPLEDESLVQFLEPDQLAVDRARPVPRAKLSTRANVALWALRVFGIVVSAMVIYTFFAHLGG